MNSYKNFGEDPCPHTRARVVNARTWDEVSVRAFMASLLAFMASARVRVHGSSPKSMWKLITNI